MKRHRNGRYLTINEVADLVAESHDEDNDENMEVDAENVSVANKDCDSDDEIFYPNPGVEVYYESSDGEIAIIDDQCDSTSDENGDSSDEDLVSSSNTCHSQSFSNSVQILL